MASPNWSRTLPHPMNIPGVMTLTTLADVREFVEDHLPPECQERDTWHLIGRLYNAARGGDIRDMVISLRLVLELERVPCLMQ
jgi:hypothetical protein